MTVPASLRILYIVPYTPNQIRVRPYNLIRMLARRGHAVTLATLWENEEEQADLARLRSDGIVVVAHPLRKARAAWNSLCAVPTTAPLQARYCWHPGLAQSISNLLERESFDAIHVEHLRGAVYGLHVKQLLQRRQRSPQSPISNPCPPIIWDSVDCISHLFAQAAAHSRNLKSRLMTRLELPRTQRYEGWLTQQFDHVLVTSPIDKAALEALLLAQGPKTSHPYPPIVILPNGVDTDYFAPASAPPDPNAPPTVVVSGKMSYHANVTMVLHLAQEIMPLVWKERPDVRLLVVGKDPPAALCNLDPSPPHGEGQRPVHEKKQQIFVTGSVPDLRLHLQTATMGSAPVLYGAGIQNKVLEAMACGLPVVVTPQAVSALTAVDGRDLIVAENAAVHAHAILDMLEDPARRTEMGARARCFVQQHHSWVAIVNQLEDIYRTTAR